MTQVLTPEQLKLLNAKLDPDDVKKRVGSDNKTLSYVDHYYVVDMANHIFGPGNWDVETVEMKREHEPVLVTPDDPKKRPYAVVTYSAKVRVTVWSEDGSRKIVRERTGGHRGFAPTIGEAIENCIKSAETDATKRAFVTFGNVFGLALYDKSQKNVGRDDTQRQIAQDRTAPIDSGFDQGAAPPRQTNSERALALSTRPPAREPSRANGALPPSAY